MKRIEREMVKHCQQVAIILAVIGVACILALTGCRTMGVHEDIFPPELSAQCDRARADAINWYVKTYGSYPRVKPVEVRLTDDPPQGWGGFTQGCGEGFRVFMWRHQPAFYGSLVHEFRHTLCLASGKSGGEGAVK